MGQKSRRGTGGWRVAAAWCLHRGQGGSPRWGWLGRLGAGIAGSLLHSRDGHLGWWLKGGAHLGLSTGAPIPGLLQGSGFLCLGSWSALRVREPQESGGSCVAFYDLSHELTQPHPCRGFKDRVSSHPCLDGGMAWSHCGKNGLEERLLLQPSLETVTCHRGNVISVLSNPSDNNCYQLHSR